MRTFGLALFLFMSFLVFDASAEEIFEENQKEIEQKGSDRDKPWRKKPKKEHKEKKKKGPSFNKQFKAMARDLLGKPHWSDRFLNLLEDDLPKIAIHPFERKDIPLTLEEASFYVDGLTRALIKEAGDRYAIVGRKEIGAVVEDISNLGTRSESQNPLGELFDRARSDLLAIGNISLSGEKIILAFKLVETESGRIVSSSQKPFKRLKKSDETVHKGYSVGGAAEAATEYLMRDLYRVGKIMVQGLTYQSTGTHSDFGRYFMGLVSDQFRKKAASGVRNIQNMDVTEFVVEEEIFRGLSLKDRGVENAALAQTRGQSEERGQDYILKGSYWVFENHVEIRLTLKGRNENSFSWRGRILKSEIPSEFELVPPPSPVEETPHRAIGPIDLYLSSNKGDNPDYKLGEKMNLVLKVQENAHVYCYYLQADSSVLRIFPNRFLKDSKITGGFEQHIPNVAMPFKFEISRPLGVEAVKCFAVDRDLKSDLSDHFRKGDFQPLTVKNERELTKLFRDLTNVTLSEATLVITTHQ